MDNTIVATLNVSFDGDSGIGENAGKNRIILEQMTTKLDVFGKLWLRVLCGIPYSMAASSGTLEMGREITFSVWREALKFSNSSSATLKYPTATGVTVQSGGVIMRKVVRNGDTQIIEATGITFRYDEEQTAIIAEYGVPKKPVNIYGVIFVSYLATYDFVYYKPGVIVAPSGSTVIKLGTVYAYHNYDVASLDIELDSDSMVTSAEYARVYSKIVLDPKGAWEFPSNWEDTYQSNKKAVGDDRQDYTNPGSFPDSQETVDADNCFVDERVHLIIKVDSAERVFYEYPKGVVDIYSPYIGSSNYHPQYHCRFASPPSSGTASGIEELLFKLNHRGWWSVFLNVDKAYIKSWLRTLYPGITFEGNSKS